MNLSVITTLYNYRNFIVETMESFLNQDMEDSEMIIVDDASTDNPYKYIGRFESDRIRYIRLDKNRGYSYAKNIGIKESKSEFLVMLDADDLLTKNGLTLRYNKLLEGNDFVHGPVLNSKNGNTYPSKTFARWLSSDKSPGCYRHIHAQGVGLRKSIHREIGLYDETLRSKSDREMWARIMNRGYKIGWLGGEDYVSIYRDHSKQMHKSKEKLRRNDLLQSIVLEKIEKRKTDLSGLEMLN